jgi:hypothetical protein
MLKMMYDNSRTEQKGVRERGFHEFLWLISVNLKPEKEVKNGFKRDSKNV